MSPALADITTETPSAVPVVTTASPLTQGIDALIAAGMHPIPLLPFDATSFSSPGKAPAERRMCQWMLMRNWPDFRENVPSPELVETWKSYPGANVGVICGTAIDDDILIGIDVDTEIASELHAILATLPKSPMVKIGKRGETLFYRASPTIETAKYLNDNRTVLEVLAKGRQSVCPPSIHPETRRPYVWKAGMPVHVRDLPTITEADMARLVATLNNLGASRRQAHVELAGAAPRASLSRSEGASSFGRELNDSAMSNFSSWVPALGLYGTRPKPGGYDAVPTFRASGNGNPLELRKRNLSFVAAGIKDFGTGNGYTPIDIVAVALGLEDGAAIQWLKTRVMPAVDGHEFDAVTAPVRLTATAAVLPAHDPVTGEIVSPLVGAAPRIIRATPFVCGPIAMVPRREWVFGRVAIRGEVTVTVAPGGVGKTAFGLAEGCAMATGRNLTGVPVEKPLRVWVWNGEEPMSEMHRRLAAIHAHHGLTDADFEGRIFVDTGNEVELVLAEQSKTVTIHRPLIDAMIAELRSRQIDVLIVDPFVSTHHVTENDNGAVQQAASAWKAVAVGANCAIMLSHHSRKLNGQEVTAESARGGDALVAKARIVRALNPMQPKQMEAFGVHETEGKSVFWIDPSGGKANMTARNGAREWYKMQSVPLYNHVRGNVDFGDEIGVVTPWQLPDRVSADLDSAKIEALKRRLLLQPWRAAAQSADRPDWVGVLIAEVFEIDTTIETWKDRAKAILSQLMQDEVKVVKARAPNRQAVNIVMPKHNADNDNEPQDDC